MKYEAFEKAAEIREEINRLSDLESLLCNAAHERNRLAALRPESYVDSAYNGDRIINEEPLDNELRDAFLRIIRDKVKELRNEFEAL
jgi:hypothetical protein